MTNDMFGRVRVRPKPKRNRMVQFRMDEISCVDQPAQEGCTVKIMKRGAPPMSISEQQRARLRKGAGYERDLFAKAGRDPQEMLPQEEEFDEDGNLLKDMMYDPQDPGAAFEKEPEEEEELEDDMEVEKDGVPTTEGMDTGGVPYEGKPRRGDWPPGSDDELDEVDLDHPDIAAAIDDEARRLQARGVGKRRADLMATARLHEELNLQKRAGTLGLAKAAGAAPTAVMGRDREVNRRVIDYLVSKRREYDPNKSHTTAMQEVKRDYPGLFTR